MSQQVSQELREGFYDAVRKEVVATIYGYWAEFHEAIGIERAAKLTVERIVRKNGRQDLPDELRWHYRKIPQVLTARRRIEEAAEQKRYAPENPPIRCIGMRKYQGQSESQYCPIAALEGEDLRV